MSDLYTYFFKLFAFISLCFKNIILHLYETYSMGYYTWLISPFIIEPNIKYKFHYIDIIKAKLDEIPFFNKIFAMNSFMLKMR